MASVAKRTRPWHQEAVYAAENAALLETTYVFADIAEVERFVAQLQEDGLIDCFGVNFVKDRSKKWAGSACKSTQTITLSRLDKRVVLHELAHISTDEKYGIDCGHNQVWRREFLRLVRAAISFPAYAELLNEYKARGLDQ